MKKDDLDAITNGVAQGRGEFTVEDADGNERAYNLVGAVNAIAGVLDEMEKYGLDYADLTDDQKETLDHGQQALQYYEDRLGSLLAGFTEGDGQVELPNGNVVDLPNEASVGAKSANLPDSAGGN